jgi:hypothetical protein
MRNAFAVLAAVAAIAVLDRDPLAYSLSGPRWPEAQTPYVVNPTNLDLPTSAATTALRAGADVWLQQANAFQFVYGGISAQTANTFDSVNLVVFRNASSGSAIATTYWWSSGGRIVDADIVFWDGAFRFFAGTTGCSGGFYIEDIAAHEFGHALGLGHSTVLGATMYPSTSSCNVANRSLDADDIAGAQALYPPVVIPVPAPPTGLRVVI